MKRTDVALISYGDFTMADVLQPSVTVIDQDPRHLGRVAAERILARIAAPTKRFRRKNVLPVELVERQSCQSRPALTASLGVARGA
jgi:LacI family transcriptional regulator